MTFYINGTQVNVLTAPTIRETLDETLDSGTLTLVFSDIDTCFSPMSDLIIIDNENNTYSFLISSDSVSLISKEPLRYQHDLTIIQNTRKLSKTQVRNTVFAQPSKPIFYCYYNATLNNNSTSDYMTFLTEYGLGYFSNTATIPNKYNVKNAYVLVDLTEIYGSKNTTSVSKQTGIVIPSISFDLYNGDTLVNSYSFDNVANGSKLYVDSSVLGSNSNYSIKNVLVGKTTLNTTGDIDYYVVNLTYNIETYIYTMYDILDILRKQIAKNEYEAISNVFSPTITITKTYVPTSGNYQVSFTLKNNNSQSATIHYIAYGSLTGNGSISLSGSATSQSIVLGAISSGSGYITAYATIGSVNSTTTTKTYTIYGIAAPTLNWLYNETYGYQYNFVNTNNIDGTLYYKVYKEGTIVTDYSTQDLTASGGSFTSTGYFNNCRMIYDYYFVSSDNRQSETITDSIILGTIPTLTAPTFSGDIGITKNSTTYTLTASITNPNNVSCKLFTRSTNTTFTSQTILPNETLTITKNELISSGSNGYIYAYLTSDNYINSSTSLKAWTYTSGESLSAPIISIVSIVQNGVVYNVNISVENNNATSCDFYGNAQSLSGGTPQNLLGSISANSQQQFTITTSLNVGYVIGQLKATNYNDSAVTSIPFSYVPPSTYTLTLHYFKDGVEDVSLRETRTINSGTEVSPVDYKKELSGYTYQDSVPNDSFNMNANNSIQYNYINSSPKGSVNNPLTANDLANNYIYWEYYSSFCVKNVTSGNVIYNLKDGSLTGYEVVYVKSGFDFTLKFLTRSGSDVRNTVSANSTSVATTSPVISSNTELNQGQLYSYTIHGLSKGQAFKFESDDDGMDYGSIDVQIV